jgi:muramoyltetrapeptide carboxypeptidase
MVNWGDQYAWTSMLRMIMQPERATEIALPTARTAVPGRASGVTLGGNLCLLMASLGTPTSRPARGGILLLEDESEEDYRVDRMLTHLRRAGYLDGVAGIICGSWHNCGPDEVLEAILLERLGDLGVPMVFGADIGHSALNQAFPIGIAAELDADARVLRLAEPPLVPTL